MLKCPGDEGERTIWFMQKSECGRSTDGVVVKAGDDGTKLFYLATIEFLQNIENTD